MDAERLRNLRSRADAKLRYARVHLNELKQLDSVRGDDFDRGHQEAFLYHLFGSKDAFLRELNEYYDCGVSQNELTEGKIKSELDKKGARSDKLAELYELERDSDAWLYHAKKMRDHSTHVSDVSRKFHCGGPADGKVWL